MNIVKHQKKVYGVDHKKMNDVDNVSRHKHRRPKDHSTPSQKEQVASNNNNIKKGDDRNSFLIKKQITSTVNHHILPNINAITLDYINNNAILETTRLATKHHCRDLVSVIIPTYNRFESLKKSIESVKNQTYKHIEIIVVNDASTQEDYYKEQLGDDIKLINLPVNMKTKYDVQSAQGLTRNEGIKIANGKWIAFLDDDDYWIPEKLQIQMYFLKKHNMKICSSNYFRGHGIFDWKNKLKYNKGLFCDCDTIQKLDTYSGVLISPNYKYSLCSTVVIRKDFLEEMEMFKLIDAEDWDLWDRIYKVEKTLFLDILLIYYDLGHAGGKHYKVGNNWGGKEINNHKSEEKL